MIDLVNMVKEKLEKRYANYRDARVISANEYNQRLIVLSELEEEAYFAVQAMLDDMERYFKEKEGN